MHNDYDDIIHALTLALIETELELELQVRLYLPGFYHTGTFGFVSSRERLCDSTAFLGQVADCGLLHSCSRKGNN